MMVAAPVGGRRYALRMRLVVLGTLATLLVAGATFACTSSDTEPAKLAEQEEEDDDAGGSPGPTPDPDPRPTPSDDASPPPEDAGSDASPPPADADVGDGNAGVLCQAGDTKETESNDTAQTADPLTGIPSVYCGRINAAGEVDHATFTLNVPGFKTVFTFTGAPVTMTATVEGQSFDLAGNSYVYAQGKPYLVKITAAGATDYRLQFQPL